MLTAYRCDSGKRFFNLVGILFPKEFDTLLSFPLFAFNRSFQMYGNGLHHWRCSTCCQAARDIGVARLNASLNISGFCNSKKTIFAHRVVNLCLLAC
jgi:hypothetical protein